MKSSSCACCGSPLDGDVCAVCQAAPDDRAAALALLGLERGDSPPVSLADLARLRPETRVLYAGPPGPLALALGAFARLLSVEEVPGAFFGFEVSPEKAAELGRLNQADASFDFVLLDTESAWARRVDPSYVLYECARVLAPGGVLLLRGSWSLEPAGERALLPTLGLRPAPAGGVAGARLAEKLACRVDEERYVPALGGEIAAEHWHRYAIAVRCAANRRVLDAGCGEGYGSGWLSSVAAEVHGVDRSAESVDRAQQLYGGTRTSFETADVAALPFPDGAFDLAVCFEVIEHVPEPGRALDELARVLTADGVLLLSTPNPEGPKGAAVHENPFHEKEYSLDELGRLLKARFDEVRWFGQAFRSGSVCFPLSADGMGRAGVQGETEPVFWFAVCGRDRAAVERAAGEAVSEYGHSLARLLEEKNHRLAELQALQLQQAKMVIDGQAAELASARNAVEEKEGEIGRAREVIGRQEKEMAKAAGVLRRREAELERTADIARRQEAEAQRMREDLEEVLSRNEEMERQSGRLQDQLRRERETFTRLLKQAGAFHCCLDQPARGWTRAGSVTLAGWLFHEAEDLVELHILVGSDAVAARCGIERPDVREHYGAWPGSLRSGFVAQADLRPGRYAVKFEAQTASGFTLTYDPRMVLRVGYPSPLGSWVAWAGGVLRSLGQLARAGWIYVERHRRLPPVSAWLSLVKGLFRRNGVSRPPPRAAGPVERHDAYALWQSVNAFTEQDRRILLERIGGLPRRPLLSVVMPVYQPDLGFLRAALESLSNQVYADWELCVALDGPTSGEVDRLLEGFKGNSNRVKTARLPERGGISACSNAAAGLAGGEGLVFLDQDDELTPDALAELAFAMCSDERWGLVYSDHDKINAAGRRYDPEFKPDYSPELLLSYMYFGHALAVRRSLFEAAGGFRGAFDGSQDYDLALRVTELGAAVIHVPRVLYHWRAHSQSTASAGRAKPGSLDAGRRAVEEALRRRDVAFVGVEQPPWAREGGLGIYAIEFPDRGPEVTLVIPTRNQPARLQRCIRSLDATAYGNWRVMVVDDESDDAATIELLRGLPADRFTVYRRPRDAGGFNFSALVNEAVARCDTEFVLLLNDDTEAIEPRWLSRMMGYARFPGVGAVGAKLLFPDQRVQHAGVLLGLHDGLAGHAFKLAARDDNGYLSYAAVARNYTAVTAACLLTPVRLFRELGGFDERRLAVAYNDADYGLRMERAGYRCVAIPGAALLHYEGASRGRGRPDLVREEAYFRQRVRRHGPDRYYHPGLSLEEPFTIVPRKPVRPTARRPRVLAVTPWLNHTGAPLQQAAVAAEIAARGLADVAVWCPSDGPLRGRYEARGLSVTSPGHPLRRCRDRAELDLITARLGEEFLRAGVDVVYAVTLDTFYSVLAARQVGLPSVWSIHESVDWRGYFAHLPADLREAVAECFAFPYRVVMVSHATADLYRASVPRGVMEVIHNGIDPRRIRGWKRAWTREAARERLGLGADEAVALSVGTVCERKGQVELVEAFAALDAGSADAMRVFIVGDRPGIYSTKLHVAASGLEPSRRRKVQIVPETEDVSLYYRAADLFVCSSRIESYPLTILEAMHMGIPVISTPVFGIREQVLHEVNGLLYAPGEARALADALRRLAGDPAERARLARNARYRLRRMNTFQDMVKAYETLLTEAAQVGGPPGVNASLRRGGNAPPRPARAGS